MSNGKGRLVRGFEDRDSGISEMDHFSQEAVAQRCSVKEVFLEISQNSQENNCTRVSFLIKLQVI